MHPQSIESPASVALSFLRPVTPNTFFLKYPCFTIVDHIESSSGTRLHAHFPKKALLNADRSSTPKPPASLVLQMMDQLKLMIFFSTGTPFQKKSRLILSISFITHLGRRYNGIIEEGIIDSTKLARTNLPSCERKLLFQERSLFCILSIMFHRATLGHFLFIIGSPRYVKGRSEEEHYIRFARDDPVFMS